MSVNITETPTPSSTDTATAGDDLTSPDQSQSKDSSTLYLFTFLATLFVLLLISSSIVLRSCILRRRFRQRYERALADGRLNDLDGVTLAGLDGLDGFGDGSGRASLTDDFALAHFVPILTDCDLRVDHRPFSSLLSFSDVVSTLCTSLYPVLLRPLATNGSYRYIAARRITHHPFLPSTDSTILYLFISRYWATTPPPTLLSRLGFPGPFTRSSQASLSLVAGPSRSDKSGSNDKDAFAESNADMLSVCVLIAMPDVSAPVRRLSMHTSSSASAPATEEAGCPNVQFGAVEVRAVGISNDIS
ncbi:hypothetical protein BU15DRAFT_77756 [Melanogaster broomeanus]|nr:hypothetical protein BU15DRAFT_77756 [Melanogaster broomeanus]